MRPQSAARPQSAVRPQSAARSQSAVPGHSVLTQLCGEFSARGRTISGRMGVEEAVGMFDNSHLCPRMPGDLCGKCENIKMRFMLRKHAVHGPGRNKLPQMANLTAVKTDGMIDRGSCG